MGKTFILGILVAIPAFGSAAAAHGGFYGGPGATTPGAPTPGAPRTPAGPSSPTTGGDDSRPADPTQWQNWWALNQAPYLRLKSHVRAGGIVTGSDEYGLGKSSRNPADALRVSASTIKTVIIPQLLEALRKQSSNDIQSSCMIALAKIGDPEDPTGNSEQAREVQREIAKRLTSSSQELSETAAVALGIAGCRANIALLTAVLENDLPKLRASGLAATDNLSVRTRAFAAYGLGLIGNRANEYDRLVINATLRKLLEGEGRSMGQRDVPAACLTSIGLTPLEVGKLENDHREPRKASDHGVLGTRQDQLQFLLSCYADESTPTVTRAQVPTAMGRLLRGTDVPVDFAPRAEVVKALLQSLDEHSRDDVAMKQSCILALGMIGDSDEEPLDMWIRATLMGVQDSMSDQLARRFALIALAQAAGRPGRFGDPLYGVNSRNPEQNARKFLLTKLSDKGQLRQWAGLAVAVLERSLDDAHQPTSQDSRFALRMCLQDARSPDDLGAFAIACAVAKDVGAKELLLEHLDSVRDIEARGWTAIALGLLNEQSAIAPLEAIVRGSKYQPELLRSTAIALGLLDDKQIVPDLIAMLSKATSLASQVAISKALGAIGDSRSVDALVGVLRNDDLTELARAFGAVALGLVADKEDLPWNTKIAVGSNYRANTASLTDGTGGILDIL